jgi:hypothetical protein
MLLQPTVSVGGSSKWTDGEANSLLEPSGSATGIDVNDIQTDTLSNDGSGYVSAGAPIDLDGHDVVDVGTSDEHITPPTPTASPSPRSRGCRRNSTKRTNGSRN